MRVNPLEIKWKVNLIFPIVYLILTSLSISGQQSSYSVSYSIPYLLRLTTVELGEDTLTHLHTCSPDGKRFAFSWLESHRASPKLLILDLKSKPRYLLADIYPPVEAYPQIQLSNFKISLSNTYIYVLRAVPVRLLERVSADELRYLHSSKWGLILARLRIADALKFDNLKALSEIDLVKVKSELRWEAIPLITWKLGELNIWPADTIFDIDSATLTVIFPYKIGKKFGISAVKFDEELKGTDTLKITGPRSASSSVGIVEGDIFLAFYDLGAGNVKICWRRGCQVLWHDLKPPVLLKWYGDLVIGYSLSQLDTGSSQVDLRVARLRLSKGKLELVQLRPVLPKSGLKILDILGVVDNRYLVVVYKPLVTAESSEKVMDSDLIVLLPLAEGSETELMPISIPIESKGVATVVGACQAHSGIYVGVVNTEVDGNRITRSLKIYKLFMR